MKTIPRLLAVGCCSAVMACGTVDPDARPSDWEEQSARVSKATAAGQYDEAVAVAEAYLKKHPGNVNGLLMVAEAALAAGREEGAPNRTARLEQAATFYGQVIETTRDSANRKMAMGGSIFVYGASGLKKFDEAERLARQMADESPGSPYRYDNLALVQTEAGRFDAALATLAEARKAVVGTDVEAVNAYGSMVYNRVGTSRGFPDDVARRLLADAVTLTNTALATDGSNPKLLRSKSNLLLAQANRAPDGGQALREESERLFNESYRMP
jgi:tetratricopeptide (TPR) repeat protein